MPVKFGEIDATQILDNEFQIRVMSRILDYLRENNPDLKMPSAKETSDIRKTVVKELQTKYPKSGIDYKES